MKMTDELDIIKDADRRAAAYIDGIGHRVVYPATEALQALSAFDEELTASGSTASSTIALLDDTGTPAAVETNGGRYFGFVVGASLPVAAAAERLALAWDNGAATSVSSPVAAKLEQVAGKWLLDILDLPRESAVGFTTSASSGATVALATARRALLGRLDWDFDERGLAGAPIIRVVATKLAHISVIKALRVLGFGLANVEWIPVDQNGAVDPSQMPEVDATTIVILQAGEVNSGEFDPFEALIGRAHAAGAWVHVDGAFGLWARASKHRALTAGIDLADSWTVDGHKWLNTPYDCAMVIVRDADELTAAMNSDAAYSGSSERSQKNLTLEFSRRARGISVWAALRTLGRDGVADLVERTMDLARSAADQIRAAGYDILNRVVLNQVIVAAETPEETARVLSAAQASGLVWFGATSWQGRPAFRISVSSWRTERADIDVLVAVLAELRRPK
jgi:glutamate/tyrosine decarboxylase-like PLP-dependent enzyme